MNINYINIENGKIINYVIPNNKSLRESTLGTNLTSRCKAILYLLSLKINNKIITFDKILRKDLNILGMSDNCHLAKILNKSFNYINTYYHKDPILDIYNIQSNVLNKLNYYTVFVF